MKELDELIEKYSIELSRNLRINIKDLESLKQTIKEQHKKDVVEASMFAVKQYIENGDASKTKKRAKQYYNDNYEVMKEKICKYFNCEKPIPSPEIQNESWCEYHDKQING